MKHFLISFILLFVGFTQANMFAQGGGKVQYGYDYAGNRITRTIFYGEAKKGSIKQDTTIDNTGSLTEKAQEEKEEYKDIIENKRVSIFPNPTKGIISIEMFNYKKEEVFIVAVYDLQGREIINEQYSGMRLRLDLSGIPDGTYILKLISENETKEWKIVKN